MRQIVAEIRGKVVPVGAAMTLREVRSWFRSLKPKPANSLAGRGALKSKRAIPKPSDRGILAKISGGIPIASERNGNGAGRVLVQLPYLAVASRRSLEGLELSALNRAANIRHEIKALVDEAIFETARAEAARFVIQHFRE
jgi:hypothetical protein